MALKLKNDSYVIQAASGSLVEATPVSTPMLSAPTFGQYKVTASAAPIGAGALSTGIVIKAKATNAGNVLIGGAGVTAAADGTGAGFILEPGEGITINVTNISAIYAVGTANDVLSFVAG